MATVTKRKPAHSLAAISAEKEWMREFQIDIEKILAAGAIKTVKLTEEEELEQLLRARERPEK